MARRLLPLLGMRTLILLLALLAAPLAAAGQTTPAPDGTVIESAEVTGLALDDLSPGLRQAISALAGQPLQREQLNALAARIEAEHPDVVAAARDALLPTGGVRVMFLVARITDSPELTENINARYVVDDVVLSGVSPADVSRDLRDELETLAGRQFDPEEAERLRQKLAAELPDYDVRRRMSRAAEPGRIRLVFEVERSERGRWLRFSPSRSKVVYHEDHGWSGVLDVDLGGRRNNQVTLGFVLGNDDDLVEEYSGYRFRFENRHAGTDRLGVSFEISRLTQDWRDVTLSSLGSAFGAPQAYRRRIAADPRLSFAITRHLHVSGGISASSLTPLEIGRERERATAFVAGAGFDRTWRPDHGARHDVTAGYEVRAGAEALASDLVYRRHVVHARYQAEGGPTTFIADFRVGRITGAPPLFERFTLGDTATLRGWNKYDLAPAGARRMWHQSVEFRYRSFAYFLDAGSVWDDGVDHEVRLGSGVGFHGDRSFLTVAFPLNADDVSATFMVGVRF
jgi:hypothetical protein